MDFLLVDISFFSALTSIFYVLGFIFSGYALWRSRTPQGAAAWIVALLSFPFFTVPLFLIFGRNKFFGYVRQRKEYDREAQKELAQMRQIYDEQVQPASHLLPLSAVVDQSQQPGFTDSNKIGLLIDGEQTFESMRAAIKSAKKYILFQFYIFRVDQVGADFVELLIEKAQQGVRVYALFDRVGTTIPRRLWRRLEQAGVHLCYFESMKGWATRFQINFRNHRKLVVVDGQTAFLGGHNIGDDYLGKSLYGAWRDTHVRISGPAAVATQASFIKDWYWATEQLPDLDWTPDRGSGDAQVLTLHTGPADLREVCLLAHLALINSAKKRVWIANAYFVPPDTLVNALLLAVLRGCEVRLLLPSRTDNRWVAYASEVYQKKLVVSGVKVFKYTAGFLHQKVILIDDEVACVGSANLDHRSMFINFEITAISPDRQFVGEVEQMLKHDFVGSTRVAREYFKQRSFFRRLMVRAVNLMAPML